MARNTEWTERYAQMDLDSAPTRSVRVGRFYVKLSSLAGRTRVDIILCLPPDPPEVHHLIAPLCYHNIATVNSTLFRTLLNTPPQLILTAECPSLRTIPTTTRSRRPTETVSSESRPTSTDREYQRGRISEGDESSKDKPSSSTPTNPSLKGVDAKFRRNHRYALAGNAKALAAEKAEKEA